MLATRICLGFLTALLLMPRLALDSAPNLVALPVSDQTLRRAMALVSREDRALAPAARALRAFLESRLVPSGG